MRRRSSTWAALAPGALALGLIPLASAGGAVPSRAPLWQVRAILPQLDRYTTAATCPGALLCVAVGSFQNLHNVGGVWRSTDGGATWQDAALPKGIPALTNVACGSPTTCEAGVIAGVRVPRFYLLGSQDGGAHWAAQYAAPSGPAYGLQLSCASATDCLVLANTGTDKVVQLATTDGGATWTRTTPATPVTSFVSGLSCVAGACEVVGNAASTLAPFAARSTTNGASWTKQTLPALPMVWDGSVSDLSCTASGTCAAIPYFGTPGGVLETANGGTTWTVSSFSSPYIRETGVVCGSSTCVAYGGTGEGAGWAERSDDGGATWQSVTFPSSTEGVNAAACPSATGCVLLGSALPNVDQVLGLTGDSATATSTLDAGEGIWSIACANATRCAAVGEMPTASGSLASVFAAAAPFSRWPASSPGGSAGTLQYVVCPSMTRCLSVGTQWRASVPGLGIVLDHPIAARSLDGGATWRPLRFAISAHDEASYAGPAGLACATATTCIETAGSEIFRTTNLGLTWSHVGLPPKSGATNVACPTPSLCVALGYDDRKPAVLRSVDGGRSWTARPLRVQGPGMGFNSIACPAPTRCLLGGYAIANGRTEIVTTSDAGLTWSRARSVPAVSMVDAVACLHTTLCFAIADLTEYSSSTVVLRSADGGQDWVRLAPPPPMIAPGDVACGPVTCLLTGSTRSGSTIIATANAG